MHNFHWMLALILALSVYEVAAWFGPVSTTIRIGLKLNKVRKRRKNRRDGEVPIRFHGAQYLAGRLGMNNDITDVEPDENEKEVERMLSRIPAHDYARRSELTEDEAEMKLVTGEVMFLLCDANEDLQIDFHEFRSCLRGTDFPLTEQQFSALDKTGNGYIPPEDVINLDIEIADSTGCYHTLLVDCASRFVMFVRAREATGKALCGGIQAYDDCVKEKADFCEDSRMDDLINVLNKAEWRLSTICPEGSETEVTLPMDCIGLETVHCVRNLMFNLHTTVAPCVAMHAYDMCVLERVSRCEGEAGGDAHPLFGEYYHRGGAVKCPLPIAVIDGKERRGHY